MGDSRPLITPEWREQNPVEWERLWQHPESCPVCLDENVDIWDGPMNSGIATRCTHWLCVECWKNVSRRDMRCPLCRDYLGAWLRRYDDDASDDDMSEDDGVPAPDDVESDGSGMDYDEGGYRLLGGTLPDDGAPWPPVGTLVWLHVKRHHPDLGSLRQYNGMPARVRSVAESHSFCSIQCLFPRVIGLERVWLTCAYRMSLGTYNGNAPTVPGIYVPTSTETGVEDHYEPYE